MNLDVVTVQDCIDMYNLKDHSTIINDGKVVGFKGKEKKIPTQTANPSGDE